MRTHYTIILATFLLSGFSIATDLMIIGNDEKIFFNEQGQKITYPPKGEDTVVIYDMEKNPLSPELIGQLKLDNSLLGPPTNMAISPDQKLAFVANSVKWVKDATDQWSPAPGNQLHLINLEGKPERISTIEVGLQPSGMDFSPDGSLLVIANRAEPTLTVLRIEGKSARVIATIDTVHPTDAVSFTPDGKRAIFVKKKHNLAGILHIDGDKITYDAAKDINVGIAPYNVVVSPRGDIALTCNIGVTGGNDGHVDTVSVIDLTVPRPRVCDVVAVGDGPEGIAFSPDGSIVLVALINGSQHAAATPSTAWAANRNGRVAVLSVDGKQVRKVNDIELGGMPEGIVFNKKGSHAYIGNFLTKDVSILKKTDKNMIDTGKRIKLKGHPASMRGRD